MTTTHLNDERTIQVIALDEDAVRAFCRDSLGVPDERIARVLDAGPNTRPERYRPEAREYHVFLAPDRRP